MTSLHHLSNAPTQQSSSSALSPVIQRKLETNNSNNSSAHQLFSRFNSSGPGTPNVNASNPSININSGQVEFDTTSIASISESSHWSGGGGDDLDNVALVNGSDTNTMENKDWSTYLRMSKNGYNSSDDDDDDADQDASQRGPDEDESSLKEENMNNGKVCIHF
jgi:hypothetical protein